MHALTSSVGGDAPERTLEQQQKGESLNELIVGITWCEHPDGDPEHPRVRVDLDLSVIAYDKDWKQIEHCSYTALTAQGMKHSGDLTSAPFPEGAREDVRLSLSELKEGTCYLALTIHNFTRQAMDEACSDASIFVATQQPGLGPGGLDIISSAALKGKGTNVLGGLLVLGEPMKDASEALSPSAPAVQTSQGAMRFVCIDQELTSSGQGNSVETTTDLVASTALTVLEGSGLSESPSKARLTTIAAYAGAAVADTVLVEHADAGTVGPVKLDREESESRLDFATRVIATLTDLEPTTAPTYAFRKPLRALATPVENLVVFGGELERQDVGALLRAVALPDVKVQPTVVVVNCRSNQEVVERRTVGRSDAYWAVNASGADVSDVVVRALAEAHAEADAEAAAAAQTVGVPMTPREPQPECV